MRHGPSGEEHEGYLGHLQHGATVVGVLAELLCNQAVVVKAFFVQDFGDWGALGWVLLAWVRLRVTTDIAEAVQHCSGIDIELWLAG